MSTINTSSSGTTYITGTIGSVDTGSLIASAVQAKMVPYNNLESEITANTSKITAYQALESQTQQLEGIFQLVSSSATNQNAFGTKVATYGSSTSTAASSILTATVSPEAQNGTDNIIVTQLAKTFTAQGSDQSSTTSALGFTGSFDIGQSNMTAATINVTASSSLQDISDAINAQTATTGVSANILQVSPGTYRLIIGGATTSDAVNVTNITGDNVLQSLGMTDGSGNFTNVTQAAQPAIISVNGTTITNDQNQFNNVLTGLSLNITGADPATTISVTVNPDVTSIVTAIENAMNGFNALQDTISENQAINSDGTVGSNSFLYGENTNSSLGTQLAQDISGTYGTGIYNGLSSMGISFGTNNQMTIDTTTLTEAVTDHLSDVESVFATADGSTGLGDTISSLLDSYSNSATGSINARVTQLQSQNSSLTQQADAIQTSVNQYQDQLIQTYAQLEAQMQAATNTKQQILALLNENTQSS